MGRGGRKRRRRIWWRLVRGETWDGFWESLMISWTRLEQHLPVTEPWLEVIRSVSCFSQLPFTMSPCQCRIMGLLFWQQCAIKQTHVPFIFIGIIVERELNADLRKHTQTNKTSSFMLCTQKYDVIIMVCSLKNCWLIRKSWSEGIAYNISIIDSQC